MAYWRAAALLGGAVVAIVIAERCAPESSTLLDLAHPGGMRINVTMEGACKVLEVEIKRGLARYGVVRPPPCPSPTGVIIHEPVKNMFFLRDVAKVTVNGTEKTVSFTATVHYEIDASQVPVWTNAQFHSEAAP